MQRYRKLNLYSVSIAICILSALAVIFASCEDTTFRSSVPTYPVRIAIDTKAVFVDFTPENLNAYITVDKDGYKRPDGKVALPVSVMDAWGYGGVVVYISMFGYGAYDLACPYCAGRGLLSPCKMHGIHAECPKCGETYDLGCGYALPSKGLSKEALRRYNILSTGDKITVTQ